MTFPRSRHVLPTPDTMSAPICPSLGHRAPSRRLSGWLALAAVVAHGTAHDAYTDTDPGPHAVSLRSAHIARVSA
jgi:hypothetical protein